MGLIVTEKLPAGSRPTWAEINLDHLAHNFRAVRSFLSESVKICAVVKADADGHGSIAAARVLEKLGADWFGVALPEEGVALRQAGISRPILCLGGFWDGQEPLMFDYDLIPAIFDRARLEKLNAEAQARNVVINYHLKVDTGMGRQGVPFHQLNDFLRGLERLTHVRLDGLMTHFASADDPGKDEFTHRQIELFNRAAEMVEAMGFHPTYRHLANSAGTYGHPQAWANMVRVGAILYGLRRDIVPPQSPVRKELVLKPVMSLRTRITFLKTVSAGTPLGYGGTFTTQRESRIATLPIGYHDGYRRALSNKARVIVRRRWVPVVGRVSMDLTLIDVTDVPEAQVGDEVVLMGQADGLSITAEDLAELVGTISYEIVCGISWRVPRVIVGGNLEHGYLPTGTKVRPAVSSFGARGRS